ncbi:hypothetical protein [Chrysiogenes arsenatis]|uniref:hypothetical protein n=1 Tax=Chrysiogenes arsenatis TaxID=309797 RepID=UPI000415A5BD|nr:hypothetical protein [Chrysiogenes arsenatis]
MDVVDRVPGVCEFCGQWDSGPLHDGFGSCCRHYIYNEGNASAPVFLTVSGLRIDLANPRVELIHWYDIVWGLCVQPRYLGHSPKGTYSIAQHSLWVMEFVRRSLENARPVDLLFALLHDAHEAYMGDIIRPLKYLPEIYDSLQAVLNGVQCVIERAFGLGEMSNRLAEVIALADQQAAAIEMHNLWPAGVVDDGLIPLPGELACDVGWRPSLPPNRVKDEFSRLLLNLVDQVGVQLPVIWAYGDKSQRVAVWDKNDWS